MRCTRRTLLRVLAVVAAASPAVAQGLCYKWGFFGTAVRHYQGRGGGHECGGVVLAALAFAGIKTDTKTVSENWPAMAANKDE